MGDVTYDTKKASERRYSTDQPGQVRLLQMKRLRDCAQRMWQGFAALQAGLRSLSHCSLVILTICYGKSSFLVGKSSN